MGSAVRENIESFSYGLFGLTGDWNLLSSQDREGGACRPDTHTRRPDSCRSREGGWQKGNVCEGGVSDAISSFVGLHSNALLAAQPSLMQCKVAQASLVWQTISTDYGAQLCRTPKTCSTQFALWDHLWKEHRKTSKFIEDNIVILFRAPRGRYGPDEVKGDHSFKIILSKEGC